MNAMQDIFERIGKIGIIPVIKIDDAKNAVPLARALAGGGIPCAEITFRTASGEEAIRRISSDVPGLLIGAGTVLTVEQVGQAVAAGAQFIVSPGFSPAVVAACKGKGIPVIPGCANPTDIQQALEFGLDVVKFFPAEQAGGIDYIKAIAAPFQNIRFIPTGGINQQNISRYMSFNKVLACGGSWMADAELINSGSFEKIGALSREAVLSLLGFHMAHIGINSDSGEAALKAANFLGSVFGFPLKDGATSVFASSSIEVLKSRGLGAQGHIAIGTACIVPAMGYLERMGIGLDYSSARKDLKGNIIAIYLKEEILGFAVQLLQNVA